MLPTWLVVALSVGSPGRSGAHQSPGASAAASTRVARSPDAALRAPAPQLAAGANALVLPDTETGHRLAVQNGTLAWLRAIRAPVAVITAIGQYRSGKSYLLNQLMEVPCDDGFGVGHRRETQTKGVWAYAADTSGANGTVRLYLDTEGFDATGKAAVYDDRIFAFSALISSAQYPPPFVCSVRDIIFILTSRRLAEA